VLQAVDVVHPWTLDPSTGRELAPFTTFSIAMIQRQSGGRLPLFVRGLQAFRRLRPGDRVLVAEACNHNRITDLCNDISMVQVGWGGGGCVGALVWGMRPACATTGGFAAPPPPSLLAARAAPMNYARRRLPLSHQIPAKVAEAGGPGVVVEHAFGREFPELDAEGRAVAGVAAAVPNVFA
jgi:hypothetical protein